MTDWTGQRVGNPIRFHGTLATEGEHYYVALPQALVRDPEVTPAATKVAALLFSNAENFEASIKQLVKLSGMAEGTVSKAVQCLIDKRWLAREALTYNRYVIHLNHGKPFTAGQMDALNTYIPSKSVAHQGGPTPKIEGGPTPKSEGGPTPKSGVVTRSRSLDQITTSSRDSLTTARHENRPISSETIDVEETPDRDLIDGEDSSVQDIDVWHPNGVHVNTAKAAGLHAVSIAEVFKEWFRAAQVESENIDGRFGSLLQHLAVDECPDDTGFGSRGVWLSDFGCTDEVAADGFDETDWWQHPRYQSEAVQVYDWSSAKPTREPAVTVPADVSISPFQKSPPDMRAADEKREATRVLVGVVRALQRNPDASTVEIAAELEVPEGDIAEDVGRIRAARAERSTVLC